MIKSLRVLLWNEEIGRLAWDEHRKLSYLPYNPEFAKWLVDAGIDEFSVTPDALIPALLGVTGETPDGKQNITVYTAEGEVFVNGQKA